MQKMSLGSYTFDRNPVQFDVPKKIKYSANVSTYSGESYFSWGTGIAGQRITLEWDWMTSTAFDQFQSILEEDAQKVWDPKSGSTYNVEVLSLDGKYVESSLLDAPWRRDVKLSLLIRSEV
jgi:hypothetical protein